MEMATFGAGCFWGVEELFANIPGVTRTSVGYMGGSKKNPTYEEVCSDNTGHAEVLHLEYDPSRVSYKNLLKIFWENHDPTTLNRQGPDEGSQYRSVVFFHTPAQQLEAAAYMKELTEQKKFRHPIVTEITPASEFYRAEEYHQQYLKKRGMSSCHVR